MSGDFIGQDKTVKIAKGHCCHGCGKWCECGEHMRYQSGVRAGAFYSNYYCMNCYKKHLRREKIRAFFSFDRKGI
jgi:hypothetical protein